VKSIDNIFVPSYLLEHIRLKKNLQPPTGSI